MRKIKALIRMLLGIAQIPRNWVWCKIHGLGFSSDWCFYGLPHVKISGRGARIKIGTGFVAVSKNSHNALGVIQPVILKALDDGAEIRIGNNVGMSGCSIVACKSVSIGDNSLIGSGVIIVDNDLHPVNPEERLIGGPIRFGGDRGQCIYRSKSDCSEGSYNRERKCHWCRGCGLEIDTSSLNRGWKSG